MRLRWAVTSSAVLDLKASAMTVSQGANRPSVALHEASGRVQGSAAIETDNRAAAALDA
jgi:hypothetical protein